MVIFVLFGILFTPIVSAANNSLESNFVSEANTQPLLEVIIEGFSVTITNIGNETAYNIQVHMWFEGLVFVGSDKSAHKDSLAPGESMTVGPGLIFGIGPAIFHVEVTYDGMIEPATDEARGFLLGSFFFAFP